METKGVAAGAVFTSGFLCLLLLVTSVAFGQTVPTEQGYECRSGKDYIIFFYEYGQEEIPTANAACEVYLDWAINNEQFGPGVTGTYNGYSQRHRPVVYRSGNLPNRGRLDGA